ncbi:MAG: lipopolysaccharide transport periplasmic protein LptA [Xanthomonadaceae bacterium]|jgi:lipopolysaccharide export system protein LptA|nr:lipopolysaccharide transport periplasmic protein LptA [Xanthomonadaceae bacterium]
MNLLPAAKFALLASVLLPALAMARTSDRNQPMTIDADRSDCSLINDGTCTFSGNVVILQGTLDIRASNAEIHRRNGEVSKIVLTGSQVRMKQVGDDGAPLDAVADQVEYDTLNEDITLIGNYTVKSPRGDNRGERMTYNTRNGQMQSGGDGSRPRTTIMPKNPAPATPAPAPPNGDGN